MRSTETLFESLLTKCACTLDHSFTLTNFRRHICTVEALHAIYGSGSTCEKSDWFKVFQGNRQFDLVSERDIHKHAEYRRLVSQIYSATSLRGQEKYIDATLTQLFSQFDQKLDHPFDISAWIQYWSFGKVLFSSLFPSLFRKNPSLILGRYNRYDDLLQAFRISQSW